MIFSISNSFKQCIFCYILLSTFEEIAIKIGHKLGKCTKAINKKAPQTLACLSMRMRFSKLSQTWGISSPMYPCCRVTLSRDSCSFCTPWKYSKVKKIIFKFWVVKEDVSLRYWVCHNRVPQLMGYSENIFYCLTSITNSSNTSPVMELTLWKPAIWGYLSISSFSGISAFGI